MNAKPCNRHDPCFDVVAEERDELAMRRERKRLGQLTRSQILRLVVADALRRKATQGERDE